MRRRTRSWRLLGLTAAVLGIAGAAAGGCLFPPEDRYPGDVVGSTGGPGGAGGGGNGNGGGGASGSCTPETSEDCYSGPGGTEGVGICHGGTRVCSKDGQWGPCEGETTPGEEACGNEVDEDCSGALCGGEVEWALAARGTGDQVVHDVAVDGNGNALVVGTFTNKLTVGSTTLTSIEGRDAFLLKIRPTGDLLSLQQFGGLGDQDLRSVAVDGDGNVYLTGYFNGTITFGLTTLATWNQNDIELFVAKLNAHGIPLWAQSLGTIGAGDEQYATGVAVVGQGDVVITGSFLNVIRFNTGNVTSAGSADVFLARLGTDGSHQWIQHWGNGATQRGVRVAAGTHVFVTGDAQGSFAMDSTTIDGGNNADVLAFRHNADGSAVGWASSFGDPADAFLQLGYDIALDPMGNVLIAGQHRGDVSFGGDGLGGATNSGFVAKLSDAGAYQWSKTFAGDPATCRGAAADSAGNVLLTGEFVGPTDFGGGAIASNDVDLFVVKLAPDGSHVWSRGFGDAQTQLGVAVAADPTDHVLVAGHFTGQLDLDVASLSANGASNDLHTLFLAKLAP